mmetsp:Transcript_31756/g.32356  ORF Transcript_31756/g.32356 Transcript_31756/m.32356 type:complete len:196 (+) Transcript_31756:159-746(+)
MLRIRTVGRGNLSTLSHGPGNKGLLELARKSKRLAEAQKPEMVSSTSLTNSNQLLNKRTGKPLYQINAPKCAAALHRQKRQKAQSSTTSTENSETSYTPPSKTTATPSESSTNTSSTDTFSSINNPTLSNSFILASAVLCTVITGIIILSGRATPDKSSAQSLSSSSTSTSTPSIPKKRILLMERLHVQTQPESP